jgi:CDP-archaeol synthase
LGRLPGVRRGSIRTSSGTRPPLIKTAGRVAWLITPVLIAGIGQVAILKAGLLPRLAVPLDLGAHWRGKPVLGPRKTWRGVIVMTTLSALTARAQAAAARHSRWLRTICPFDYRQMNPWLLGATLGLGYCIAELPNSFVKRRLGIAPARTSLRWARLQYFIDQSDSVAGCLAALRLFYRPTWTEAGLAFAGGLALHVAVDQGMHAVGVKQRDYKPSHTIPSALATAGTGRLSRP